MLQPYAEKDAGPAIAAAKEAAAKAPKAEAKTDAKADAKADVRLALLSRPCLAKRMQGGTILQARVRVTAWSATRLRQHDS